MNYVIFDKNDTILAYVDQKGLNDWLEFKSDLEWYFQLI